MFRSYPIKKGDVITYRGEKIQIIAIGKDILGKKIPSNEKVHLKFSQIQEIVVKNGISRSDTPE
jgi:NMD protein affecting ribosome stability and mRNA decay